MGKRDSLKKIVQDIHQSCYKDYDFFATVSNYANIVAEETNEVFVAVCSAK